MRRLGMGFLALGIWVGTSMHVRAEPASEPASGSASAPATRGAEEKPGTKVLSLMVTREVDDAAFRALMDSPGGGEYKTGVQLVCRVVLPAGNVVAVDPALRVDKFADDKGTDLGNGVVKPRFEREENTQCYLSADRKRCTFWLGSPTLPAAGAEKLLVEGSLNVQMGVGEKAGESKELPLKLGQEYEAGNLKLTIAGMNAEGPDGQVSVEFAGEKPLGPIKAVECTDEAGKTVAVGIAERYGQRDSGGLTITLSRPVKGMKLRVVRYEKVETVKVPVKLEVKVGLGEPVANQP